MRERVFRQMFIFENFLTISTHSRRVGEKQSIRGNEAQSIRVMCSQIKFSSLCHLTFHCTHSPTRHTYDYQRISRTDAYAIKCKHFLVLSMCANSLRSHDRIYLEVVRSYHHIKMLLLVVSSLMLNLMSTFKCVHV